MVAFSGLRTLIQSCSMAGESASGSGGARGDSEYPLGFEGEDFTLGRREIEAPLRAPPV